MIPNKKASPLRKTKTTHHIMHIKTMTDSKISNQEK